MPPEAVPPEAQPPRITPGQASLPARFLSRLRLPAIAAPLFLVSGPALVIATCKAGVVGTFPALNARTTADFETWLDEIEEALEKSPDAAPYGVNLIVHKSNNRLDADLDTVIRRRVPLVITSLGAVPDLVAEVHSYGGLVFHDVINRRHGEKAAEAGVDGLIAVSAGAGGHTGSINPFALLHELRSVFSGPLILSGSLSTGRDIAAARMMGAELAYLGTRFIATREAMADPRYKEMVVRARAGDIMVTPNISGVNANFLKESIAAAGLDPDNLPAHGMLDLASEAKAWKSIWSAGHGVSAIEDIPSVGALCERLIAEYRAAFTEAARDPFT